MKTFSADMESVIDVREIKEVIVFCEQGDPRQVKTWSNVPYFLVATLESKGVKVHTVDLSLQNLFQKTVRRVYEYIFPGIFKNTAISYYTSIFYNTTTNQKIRKSVQKYSEAGLNIFTTFSFSATKISSKPSILFCDWTIEHYIRYFLNKEPNFLERQAINRQNKIIENAEGVFVLFPTVARTMQKMFSNPNIFYKGNVINNLVKSSSRNIEDKMSHNSLLFVGSKKYLKGATDLITAFNHLKKRYTDLNLHIIGIKPDELPDVPADVYVHGYLDKGKADDVAKYYELIRNARIFINTTPKWASFSASLEAMYFYTPLIVPAYDEFTATFGRDIQFGSYYDAETDLLGDKIEEILDSRNYRQMCLNANSAVSGHTWDAFVDQMLETTRSLLV